MICHTVIKTTYSCYIRQRLFYYHFPADWHNVYKQHVVHLLTCHIEMQRIKYVMNNTYDNHLNKRLMPC
jgi:hypothetical protein